MSACSLGMERINSRNSGGSATCRPNGAGSSRRLDLSRNSCSAGARSLNYRGAKRGITAAGAVRFRARARPPGTEFLDAETGRQKSPPKQVGAHRDKNPRNEWPKLPVETPCLASCRKRSVCKDWMVVEAVVRNPSQMGIRAKYRAKTKKAHKSLAGKPPEPSIDGGFREKRA